TTDGIQGVRGLYLIDDHFDRIFDFRWWHDSLLFFFFLNYFLHFGFTNLLLGICFTTVVFVMFVPLNKVYQQLGISSSGGVFCFSEPTRPAFVVVFAHG